MIECGVGGQHLFIATAFLRNTVTTLWVLSVNFLEYSPGSNCCAASLFQCVSKAYFHGVIAGLDLGGSHFYGIHA
jgi:hypothetical protein